MGTGGGTLRIDGGTLHSAAGAGLFLHGAVATLVGPTFRDNAIDVVQQSCSGGLPAVDGLDAATTTRICPASDTLVLELDYDPAVDLGGITSQ